MRKACRLLPLLGLLAACGPGEDMAVQPNPANREPGYFDVKAFLDQQTAALNRRRPVLEKQVQLRDGQPETTRIRQTDWRKELQLFYQADINKPALRGAYAEVASPPYSNAERQGQESYVLKPEAEGTVKSLVVHTLGDTNQVQELTAVIRQDNALFYSEKKLRLTCKQGQMVGYEVRGVQKLVLFDSVRYVVRARVVE